MKLLVVSQYFWPEPFRINDICDGLVARGHQVDVLTSLPNVPQGTFYAGYGWCQKGPTEHNGVRIDRVRVVPRGKGGGLRWILNCGSFALNSLLHLPKLRKQGYDAIFVFENSPVSQILPAKRLAKKMGIPNIIFVLDIWPESMYFLLGMGEDGRQSPLKKMSYNLSKWLYQSGDMLLISSEGFAEKLRSMGIDGEIRFFPNYAELPRTSENAVISRGELGIHDADFVVGFAGNVGKAQGLDKLVAAASRDSDGNRKYLVVGDGSELAVLRQFAQDAGVADRFVFTGWVDGADVPGYLACCDAVLVSLENHEVLNLTVPAKLQTYMNAAKPVIAFLNGAGADVVNAANCGVTAKAGDVDALCAAMDKLACKSKSELALLGENGRRYCAQHYDREMILDKLVQYLEEAIAAKKAGSAQTNK